MAFKPPNVFDRLLKKLDVGLEITLFLRNMMLFPLVLKIIFYSIQQILLTVFLLSIEMRELDRRQRRKGEIRLLDLDTVGLGMIEDLG